MSEEKEAMDVQVFNYPPGEQDVKFLALGVGSVNHFLVELNPVDNLVNITIDVSAEDEQAVEIIQDVIDLLQQVVEGM